jgi:hypothetical protein
MALRNAKNWNAFFAIKKEVLQPVLNSIKTGFVIVESFF